MFPIWLVVLSVVAGPQIPTGNTPGPHMDLAPIAWEQPFASYVVKLRRKADPTFAIGSLRPLDCLDRPERAVVTFNLDRRDTMDAELWMAPIGVGTPRHLATEFSSRIVDALASPDGRYIAYDAQAFGIDATGKPRRLTVVEVHSGRRVPIASDANGVPAWSSDSRTLFLSRSIGDGCRPFRASSLAGRPVVEALSESPFDGPVTFSPNGRRLAGSRQGRLVIEDLAPARMVGSHSVGGTIVGGAWSPDSQWFVFTTKRSHIITVTEQAALHAESGRIVPLPGRVAEDIVGSPGPRQFLYASAMAWLPGASHRLLLIVRRREYVSDMGPIPFEQLPVTKQVAVIVDPDRNSASEAKWMPVPRPPEMPLAEPALRFSANGTVMLMNDGRGFVLYRSSSPVAP